MNIFGKKPADPENDFVTGLNNLIRSARRNGVSRRTMRGHLQGHADGLDRELAAASERRKMGDPISSYNPNRPR
jgi:hypothetical protein